MRIFQKLETLIADYGGLIQTGPFGSQLHQHEYVDEGIPVVMPKDINDGQIDLTKIARISEQKAFDLSRHILKKGNIVFPRRGEVSKCTLIREEQEGFLCGTGCLKIELPKNYSPQFLYYYLSLPQVVQWFEKHAIGTTMLNLNTSIIGRVEIPNIEFSEQEKIAGILSSYDGLIQNNCRRIQLLEESARLLYKEWFIRLRFPGHEHVKIVDGVPDGWEKLPLGQHIKLNYGKALKAEDRIDGPYPVYGSSGIVGTHESPLVAGPGIIIGRKGNVGSIYWSSKDFYPIDTVYFINAESSNLYLYYTLQFMQFISTDVAVPGLNRDLAYSRLLLIPNQQILVAFLEQATPIHEQIDKLRAMNAKLSQARDLLLPRLMNGEITV